MIRLDHPLITLTDAPSPARIPDLATQLQRELSTYWMPLCEPIYKWTAFAQHTEYAPALTAVGDAFFALSLETKALRYFTLACEQQQGRMPIDSGYWYKQAVRALLDASHHWSRAAYALDTLTPDEPTADDLHEARSMSRAARAQQERLWKLTDEVRAARADWRQSSQPAVPREVQA